MQCPPKLTGDLFPSFLSFPTGLAHVGLFAWADEVGSLPQVFMLVLGVVRSLCSVLCDCSSFYFLPKKERRLQISYKRAAIYQMISRSSYGIKKRGLASRIRIELYSCPNCFPYVFSKQQRACLFYMYGCMDCYTYILHAQYSVCTYTDYCIFCAHEIFTLDKVWVSLSGRAGIV